MNKLISILAICSIFSQNVSRADQVANLNKGDDAPFSGILFDQERANQTRVQLLEHDLYKEIMDSQTKSIELLKQNNVYSDTKVQTLLDQNDKLAKQLESSQSFNTWERIGLITLGVLMTVGAGLAIRGAAK